MYVINIYVSTKFCVCALNGDILTIASVLVLLETIAIITCTEVRSVGVRTCVTTTLYIGVSACL